MFNEIVVANKNYAAFTVSNPQNLDETAIKVVRNDCPPFLLPIGFFNFDNQLQLRYEIMGGIRLSYMPLKMRKMELNQLLEHMLAPFMDCADWFLDYRSIYLDRDYIIVDQNDYKVKYIYMPLRDNKTNTEETALKFLGELVMEVDLEDDPAYITSVMRCIMGKEASLHALTNLLRAQPANTASAARVQPANAAPIAKTPPGNTMPVSGAQPAVTKQPQKSESSVQEKNIQEKNIQEKKKQEKEVQPERYGQNNLAGAIGAELFGDDSGKKSKKESKKENKADKNKKSKGFFGKLLEGDKKTKKEAVSDKELFAESTMASQPPQPVSNNYYAQEALQESFNTEIAEDEEVYDSTDKLRMRLESSAVDNVPQLIELDMSRVYAVVGRYDKTGKMSADFNFDMSLTFIGRRHARFEKAGEDFFVIDLESKNHTYLNDEELLPNRRYPIHRGDRITFTKKYGITYRVC